MEEAFLNASKLKGYEEKVNRFYSLKMKNLCMTNDINKIKVRREIVRIYLKHLKWTKDRRRNTYDQ